MLIIYISNYTEFYLIIIKTISIIQLFCSGNTIYVRDETQSDFTSDITPLLLAAQLGNSKILKFLLDKKHRIKKPHSLSCYSDIHIII